MILTINLINNRFSSHILQEQLQEMFRNNRRRLATLWAF